MPEVPAPETLPTLFERFVGYEEMVGQWPRTPPPIDLRYVDDPPWMQREKGPRPPLARVWMKADGCCRTTRCCTCARWRSPRT